MGYNQLSPYNCHDCAIPRLYSYPPGRGHSARIFLCVSLNEGSGHRAARPRWFAPLMLFVAALAIFIPTAADSYANWDPYASSLSAWRIATTGQPWMEGVDFNELTGVKDPTVWQSEIDGHLVTTRMYGPILAAVPFYWLNSYGDEADFSIYRGGMAASVLVAARCRLPVSCRSPTCGRHQGTHRRRCLRVRDAGLVGRCQRPLDSSDDHVRAGRRCMGGEQRPLVVGGSVPRRRDVGTAPHRARGGDSRPRRGVEPSSSRLSRWPSECQRRSSLVALGAWNNYVFGSWNPLGVYAEPPSDIVGLRSRRADQPVRERGRLPDLA